MKTNKEYLLFPVIVITGLIILCSILLVKHTIVTRYFNFGGGNLWLIIIESGYYLALFLGIILTGFIAAYIFSTECIFQTNRLVMSAGAGMLAALLPSFFLYNLPFLILSAAFGGVGAYLFSLIDQSSQNASQESEKQPGKRISVKTAIILFIVSILLCMFVPLGISCAVLVAGVDGGEGCNSCIYPTWNPSFKTTITRPDASSINVVMTGDYSLPQSARIRNLIDPLKLPLKITIDGKDFSNQNVIRQQGLNATITPPEGITHYRDGMSILISGPDVMQNGPVGSHIILANDYYPNQEPLIIVDSYV